MPTNAEQAHSFRRGLILTTMIAVVFWASDNNGINWVVNLSGTVAWLFLALAHGYQYAMWQMWREDLALDQLINETKNSVNAAAVRAGKIALAGAGVNERGKRRVDVVTLLPAYVSILGWVVIGGNLVVAAAYDLEMRGLWPF